MCVTVAWSRSRTWRFGLLGWRGSALLALLGLVGAGLVSCTDRPPEPPPPTGPFAALQGWQYDDHLAALKTFRVSCEKIESLDPRRRLDPETPSAKGYGTVADWLPVCAAAKTVAPDQMAARRFFETWFVPEVSPAAPGLITGYYEPVYRGSLSRHGAYQYPLLSLPPAYRDKLRMGELLPTRAEINQGVVDPNHYAIVWLADPLDAFLLHVQGSGQVVLENGSAVRVGFAAKNGHPYTSIGGVLVRRGELARDEVSMASIRRWVSAHPAEAQSLFEENASYIFFRRLDDVPSDLGPLGAQSVPLTAQRSLAVDRREHPLGVPVWLETQTPTGRNGKLEPFRRLMIAQDTGSAIRGPNRGDIFWGRGEDAGKIAGEMDSRGRIVALRLRQPGP